MSIYFTPDFISPENRLTTFNPQALCTPTHVNVAMPMLMAYSNYYWFTVGSVGNSQKQGVYTTTALIEDGRNGTKYNNTFYADFWRDYATNDDLIGALAESNLRNNTQYYPPHGMFCPPGLFGCQDQCSKTYACTLREANDHKECLVVVAMSFLSTVGLWPSIFANLNIPAYFCYIGRDGLQDFVMDMYHSGKGVIFYMNDPDEFLSRYRGLFQRISMPKADAEALLKNTWQFGENGYGQPNNNPVRVEFMEDVLQKVCTFAVQKDSANAPAMTLLSRFRILDVNVTQLLQNYVNLTNGSSSTTPDNPYFDASCQWIRDNYAAWQLWMDPMPQCSIVDHMNYTISGCNDSTIREISFRWKLADPLNSSKPYECDGGMMNLPSTLRTSRPCEWLNDHERDWIPWVTAQPTCDPSFFTYQADPCSANGKRSISFGWLLPDTANASKSLECIRGDGLPSTKFVDCEYMPTSSSVFIAISALVVALAIVILVSMVLVFKYRNIPIIRRSQYEFLETMLVGALCICAAALAYSGEPTDALCALRPALLSTGFTMIFGSLVVKSLRVYRVFMSKKMKRVVLPTSTMFKILGSFVLVDGLVLAAWFIADFPNAADVEYSAESIFFGATLKAKRCESSSFIFSALLIFWKAILLCAGLYLSFLIRNVSLEFQESIWIFGSSVVVGFGCVLLLPMAYLVTIPATTFYIFLSVGLWLCTLVIVGMMLTPKLVRHKEAASYMSSASSGTEIKSGTTTQDGSNPNPTPMSAKRASKPYMVRPSDPRRGSMNT